MMEGIGRLSSADPFFNPDGTGLQFFVRYQLLYGNTGL